MERRDRAQTQPRVLQTAARRVAAILALPPAPLTSTSPGGGASSVASTRQIHATRQIRARASVRCLAGLLRRPERAQPLGLPSESTGPRQHLLTKGGRGPAAAEPHGLCPATAAGGGEGRERW